jgi:hypothetical protein
MLPSSPDRKDGWCQSFASPLFGNMIVHLNTAYFSALNCSTRCNAGEVQFRASVPAVPDRSRSPAQPPCPPNCPRHAPQIGTEGGWRRMGCPADQGRGRGRFLAFRREAFGQRWRQRCEPGHRNKGEARHNASPIDSAVLPGIERREIYFDCVVGAGGTGWRGGAD